MLAIVYTALTFGSAAVLPALLAVVAMENSETPESGSRVSDSGRGFQRPEAVRNLAQTGKLGLIGEQR